MGKSLEKNNAEEAKKAKAKLRRKKIAAFIWCTLECMFISGYTNGWVFIKEALTEQHYFLDECNITKGLTTGLGVDEEHGTGAMLFGINGIDEEIENTIREMHKSKNIKCVYRKVLKEMTVDEFEDLYDDRQTLHEVHNVTVLNCAEQNDTLQTLHAIATLVKCILIFPLWLILDTYGTSRTRIIAMCGTAVGSLTMLFSSEFYPWLIFPALLTLGLSGSLVLLTDLQVANLFGGRRYTVMSIFVGAYFSGGIVIFFMKLTKASGVSLQTSFMFTTIGIVPVLISTIAMLPKSRIPWPVPADYRKGKSSNNGDKGKAWQRRMSVGPKKKMNMGDFWAAVKSKLFLLCIVWFSLLSLKIRMFDITLETRLQRTHTSSEANKYMSWYAIVLLLSLPMSPFIGVVMDWNRRNVSTQPHVVQMKNIFNAMCLQLIIALASSVTSFFPNMYIQVLSYIFTTIEKVSLYAVFFAFLMHVNFPSEHFGKLAGVVISLSGLTLILQFPLKLLTQHAFTSDETYIYLIPLVLVLVSGLHPFCVWYHCRTGHINNSAGNGNERDRTLTVVLMEPTTTKASRGERNTRDNENKTECTETTKLQITDL